MSGKPSDTLLRKELALVWRNYQEADIEHLFYTRERYWAAVEEDGAGDNYYEWVCQELKKSWVENYQDMQHNDEYSILADIAGDVPIATILGIGDIYSILREHYNNEILDHWRSAKELMAEEIDLDELEEL